MPKIITIGSATRDIFVRSSALEIVKSDDFIGSVDACFPLGAKIDISDLALEIGGGATNAAVTFSRLGNEVATISAVGDDPSGRDVRELLEAEGISSKLIQTSADQTALGLILLAGTGERTVFVYRGASENIDPNKIPWTKLKADWMYITSLGGKIEVLERLLSHANKIGCRIAWNPGNKELQNGLTNLHSLIRQVDVFNLNREEMMHLVGTTDRDLHVGLNQLRGLPKLAVVITDGSHGAYAANAKNAWFVPSRDVKRVNVTGAGDAFGSGFVAGLTKKLDLPYALAVGLWNASSVIQQMGAKRGIIRKLPTPAQVKSMNVKVWK